MSTVFSLCFINCIAINLIKNSGYRSFNSLFNLNFFFQIEYVDYGTIGRVAKTDLRFLHKDFLELPAQGIRAKLTSILPPNDCEKWPPETCRKLLDMVSNRRLYMEACSIDYEVEFFSFIL